ncbi:hypothetical protein [Streptomyces longispororuber]|uniref:hypothetical protein n=1 Tax=Streptomyces longispororuber TaxID=68230 RepID=UPI0036FCE26C
MKAALVLPSSAQLSERYGPMRPVLGTNATELRREQRSTYTFALLGGKTLRESLIKDSGCTVLSIALVEYIDPVTLKTRYAVHHCAFPVEWATDHPVRLVAESAYEDAVRAEFAAPTLTLSREQFTRGLASFYDVTDVQF